MNPNFIPKYQYYPPNGQQFSNIPDYNQYQQYNQFNQPYTNQNYQKTYHQSATPNNNYSQSQNQSYNNYNKKKHEYNDKKYYNNNNKNFRNQNFSKKEESSKIAPIQKLIVKESIDPIVDSKNCEICKLKIKKYKCPGCGIRSCGLLCLKQHKNEKNCDGKYKPEKFISKNQISEKDGLKDYNYLNNILNSSEKIRKNLSLLNRKGNSTDALRFKLLRVFSKKIHGIDLKIMPFIMTRHRENLSFYFTKMKKIYWSFEILLYLENIHDKEFIRAFTNDPISEDLNYTELLKEIKFFDSELVVQNKINLNSDNLIDLISKNELVIMILKSDDSLKRGNNEEGQIIENKDEKNEKKYEILNLNCTISESLKGKQILEYPKIYLVFQNDLNHFLAKYNLN